MTQFPQQGYYDSNAPVAPAKTSGLAITALVFSLLGIIPCLGLITAPLGLLLGVIGAVTIGPPKKGKGMAVAALIIGLILTAGQFYGSKKAYDFFYGFYAIVMNGPNDALTKGFAGDVAGFKSSFYGAGASATNAEAQAFLDELRKRYGAFTSAAIDQQPGQQAGPQPGQAQIVMPYDLRFGGTTVKAETEIIFADQSTGGMVKKLGYVRVIDATNGDLTYPPGAAGSTSTTPPPVPPAEPPATAPNG